MLITTGPRSSAGGRHMLVLQRIERAPWPVYVRLPKLRVLRN